MSGNQMALYIPPPPIVPKGSLVNLDLDGSGNKQYRVIKCNGNVAQVMAMYDTLTSKWNAYTSRTTTMGTLTVAKYDGSDIDMYKLEYLEYLVHHSIYRNTESRSQLQ